MAAKLIIIPEVYPLPAPAGTPDQVRLGVTLSAAFDGDVGSTDVPRLRLWEALAPIRFSIAVVRPAARAGAAPIVVHFADEVSPVTFEGPPVISPVQLHAALNRALVSDAGAPADVPAIPPRRWSNWYAHRKPTGGDGDVIDVDPDLARQNNGPLPNSVTGFLRVQDFLATLARFPTPIPQALNLAFVLQFRKPAAVAPGTYFVVAPFSTRADDFVFGRGRPAKYAPGDTIGPRAPTTHATTTPATTTATAPSTGPTNIPSDSGAPGPVEWPYENAGPLPIACSASPVPADAPPSAGGAWLDLDDQAVVAADWTATLPRFVADAIDPAAAILERLDADLVGTTELTTPERIDAVRRTVANAMYQFGSLIPDDPAPYDRLGQTWITAIEDLSTPEAGKPLPTWRNAAEAIRNFRPPGGVEKALLDAVAGTDDVPTAPAPDDRNDVAADQAHALGKDLFDLRARLTDPEGLRAGIARYWAKIDLPADVHATIAANLQRLDPRDRLTRDAAELVIRDFVTRLQAPNAMPATSLRDAMRAALGERVHAAIPGDVANHPRTWLTAWLAQVLDARCERIARNALAGDAKAAPGAGPIPARALDAPPVPDDVGGAQGVTIRFASPTGTDLDDLARQYSGVAVVMKRTTPLPNDPDESDWCLLNMADVSLHSPADHGGATALSADALVPQPLTLSPTTRSAFLTYNNVPLTARSHLSKATGEQHVQATAATAGDPFGVSLDFTAVRRAPASPGRWRRLPGLYYGCDYLVRVFLVHQTGALPSELQDRHPAQLLDAKAAQARLSAMPRGKLIKIAYRRPSPVSTPRILNPIPPIPAGVAPLAAELRTADGTDGPARSKGLPKAAPIVLLPPPRGARDREASFVSPIAPPTVDFQTWDRWCGRDAVGSTAKAIAARVRRLRAHNVYFAAPDRTVIHDPAVDGTATFRLEAERVYPPPGKDRKIISSPPYPLNPVNDEDPTGFVQVTNPTLTIQHLHPKDTEPEGFDPRVPTLRVRCGQVWRVRLWFEPHPKLHGRFDGAHPRPAKLEIDIETVPPLAEIYADSKKLEDAQQKLWHDLDAGFDPAKSRVTLSLAKSVATATEPTHYDFFSGMEVHRQSWAWRGQPAVWIDARTAGVPDRTSISRFPFDAAYADGRPDGFASPAKYANIDKDAHRRARLIAWEFSAMSGVADDLDFVVARALLTYGRKSYPLFEHDVAPDRRALYFRLGARMRSRYPGIRDADVTLEAMLPKPAAPSGGPALTPVQAVRTRWRRVWVPSRFSDTLPKPSVRMVVPLTRSWQDVADGVGPARSALVVVDDAAFEFGGPAEDFEPVLATATIRGDTATGWAKAVHEFKSRGTPGDVEIAEFGPDPAVSLQPFWDPPPNGRASELSSDILRQAMLGPVGHTFDTGSRQPLINATSYIVRLPDSALGRQTHAWPMAKLRFRRAIRKQGLLTVQNGGGAEQATADLVSAPSDPVWVQFLPDAVPATKCLAAIATTTVPLFRLATGGEGIDFAHASPTLVAELEEERWFGFEWWLLLTSVTRGFRGEIASERYVAVLPLHLLASNENRGIWEPLFADGRELAARLLRVQVRRIGNSRDFGTSRLVRDDQPGDQSAGMLSTRFWEALFRLSRAPRHGHDGGSDGLASPDAAPDARGRIVSVSPRVPAALGRTSHI